MCNIERKGAEVTFPSESESESTFKVKSDMEQKSPFQPVEKSEVQGESSIGKLTCMNVGVDQAGHDELVLVQSHHLPLLAQLLQHSILVSASVSKNGKG